MSRALPGGMLNSKEKTEYEDWLEKLHKEIDSTKTKIDSCPMPLMDNECGKNGCHNYDGSIITNKNKTDGNIIEADTYEQIRENISKSFNELMESLCRVDYLTAHLKEDGENESVLAKRNHAIRYELADAKAVLTKIKNTLRMNQSNVGIIISQKLLYEFEECLKKTCETIDGILKTNHANKQIVIRAVKDVSDEANNVIDDLNKYLEKTLEFESIMKLKNRDDSQYYNSFKNLKEFNDKVMHGAFAKIGSLAKAG